MGSVSVSILFYYYHITEYYYGIQSVIFKQNEEIKSTFDLNNDIIIWIINLVTAEL